MASTEPAAEATAAAGGKEAVSSSDPDVSQDLHDALLSDTEEPRSGKTSSKTSGKTSAHAPPSPKPAGYDDLLSTGALMKKVLTPGTPDTRPNKGDIATIKVTVTVDGKVVEKDAVDAFRLGEADVCPAWDICVQMMNVGETAHLIGSPRFDKRVEVNANSRVEYNITLEKVETPPLLIDLPISERTKLAYEKRKRGNVWFGQNELDSALHSYKRGVMMIDLQDVTDAQMDQQKDSLPAMLDERCLLLNNIARAHMAAKAYTEAIASCDLCLKNKPENVTALYIKAKCLMFRQEPEESLKVIEQGLAAATGPEHASDVRTLQRLKQEVINSQKVIKQKTKELEQRMALGLVDPDQDSADTVEAAAAAAAADSRPATPWFLVGVIGVIVAVFAYFAFLHK